MTQKRHQKKQLSEYTNNQKKSDSLIKLGVRSAIPFFISGEFEN